GGRRAQFAGVTELAQPLPPPQGGVGDAHPLCRLDLAQEPLRRPRGRASACRLPHGFSPRDGRLDVSHMAFIDDSRSPPYAFSDSPVMRLRVWKRYAGMR